MKVSLALPMIPLIEDDVARWCPLAGESLDEASETVGRSFSGEYTGSYAPTWHERLTGLGKHVGYEVIFWDTKRQSIWTNWVLEEKDMGNI